LINEKTTWEIRLPRTKSLNIFLSPANRILLKL
jgi:hypothetical protein